jgi:hypothetical protein
MLILVAFIVISVLLGLGWAYFNFSQIKEVPLGGGSYNFDDELHNMNKNEAMGIV